jgi:hypothetical protein
MQFVLGFLVNDGIVMDTYIIRNQCENHMRDFPSILVIEEKKHVARKQILIYYTITIYRTIKSHVSAQTMSYYAQICFISNGLIVL